MRLGATALLVPLSLWRAREGESWRWGRELLVCEDVRGLERLRVWVVLGRAQEGQLLSVARRERSRRRGENKIWRHTASSRSIPLFLCGDTYARPCLSTPARPAVGGEMPDDATPARPLTRPRSTAAPPHTPLVLVSYPPSRRRAVADSDDDADPPSSAHLRFSWRALASHAGPGLLVATAYLGEAREGGGGKVWGDELGMEAGGRARLVGSLWSLE